MKKQVLVDALRDISRFHEEGFDCERLEKKWGFLGWTCCEQLQSLAKAALQDGVKRKPRKR